ncbi:MAG TPA: lyase family protein, partial [Thermotogota bacterium]|nr:lyase family protein [Thermotogota bacterium]
MKLSKIYDTLVLNRTYEHFLSYLKTPFNDVNKAHLIMLRETGILSEEIVKSIKDGLIRYDAWQGFPEKKPAEVEDYFFYAEQTLSQFIGTTAAGSLHIARSRNDMDTTLFRMVMREDIAVWMLRALRLLEALIAHGRQHLATPVVLFTHGQPAQISSYAHYLGAMVEEMAEVVELQHQAYEIVNRCPMGAGAITTTGFPIDRNRVATLLGFFEPIRNSYQAISTSHGFLVPIQNWIVFLNDLTRFIEDVLHKSSFEVGILSYPDDLVQV